MRIKASDIKSFTKEVKPSEAIRADYERVFAGKAKQMAHKRKVGLKSQYEMARLAGCSVRKIQSFEAGNCFDAYLLFVYKGHL